MAERPSFIVLEFWGRGDPFFGGSADDRVLSRVADGFEFRRGCIGEPPPAVFGTEEEAWAAADRAPRREGGLVSVVPRLPHEMVMGR